jgi:hypothetical protein
LPQHNPGVKDIVGEIGDRNSIDCGSHVIDDGAHEIVWEWSGRANALELHGDGFCFVRANPDRQMPFAVDFFENDDAVLSDQTNSYAFDDCLDHAKTSGRWIWAGQRRKLPEQFAPSGTVDPR